MEWPGSPSLSWCTCPTTVTRLIAENSQLTLSRIQRYLGGYAPLPYPPPQVARGWNLTDAARLTPLLKVGPTYDAMCVSNLPWNQTKANLLLRPDSCLGFVVVCLVFSTLYGFISSLSPENSSIICTRISGDVSRELDQDSAGIRARKLTLKMELKS